MSPTHPYRCTLHTFCALVFGVPKPKAVPKEQVPRAMHCKVHNKLPIVETDRLQQRWGHVTGSRGHPACAMQMC